MQPDPRFVNQGVYRLINGAWHKRCAGPSHEDGPVYLPANEKYFYRLGRGNYRYICRLCSMYKRTKTFGVHGLVPLATALPIYTEAVNRIGIVEVARRSGLTDNGIRDVLNERVRSVRKSSLRAVMLVLVSARRHGEHTKNRRTINTITRRANGAGSSCVGCGCHLDNYTEGCKTCLTRRAKREQR